MADGQSLTSRWPPVSRPPVHRPPLAARPPRARDRRARRRVEVVLPRRARRARGRRGGARAAPVDRPPPARARRARRTPWPRPPGHRAVPRPRALTSCPSPGRTRVHRRGDALLVPGRRSAPGARALVPPRRARRRSPRAWTPPPREAGTRYRGLSIRGQRTRWASCSSTGAMSFNWRLLLAPEAVARLRRLARGLPPRGDGPLAALLGAARAPLPGWREHARWLRRYGPGALAAVVQRPAQRRVGGLARALLDDLAAHAARSTPRPSRRRARRPRPAPRGAAAAARRPPRARRPAPPGRSGAPSGRWPGRRARDSSSRMRASSTLERLVEARGCAGASTRGPSRMVSR